MNDKFNSWWKEESKFRSECGIAMSIGESAPFNPFRVIPAITSVRLEISLQIEIKTLAKRA